MGKPEDFKMGDGSSTTNRFSLKKDLPSNRKIAFWARIIFAVAILLTLVWNYQKYSRFKLVEHQVEMSPKLVPGDGVVLYRHLFQWGYHVGDVLYACLEKDSEPLFVKIIAQDHGRVKIRDQAIFVDEINQKIDIDAPPEFTRDFAPLKEGEVFFVFLNQLGCSKKDSLILGALKKDQVEVKGKIFIDFDTEPARTIEAE